MILEATHYGRPRGAMRHRTGTRGGRAMAYHDPRHTSEEAAIAALLRGAMPAGWSVDGPWRLALVSWVARPARLKRKADRGTGPIWHPGKPDADNIAKIVMDAATKAAVWRDDSYCCQLSVERWYLGLGSDGLEIGLPRVEIRIETAHPWRHGRVDWKETP